MRSIAEQLRTALAEKGWSLPRLVEETGLDCTPSSMSRKLGGLQKLSTDEAQVIADALQATIVWPPRRRAA